MDGKVSWLWGVEYSHTEKGGDHFSQKKSLTNAVFSVEEVG